MKPYLFFVLVFSILFGCSSDDDNNNITPVNSNQFTDPRDNQTYDIVNIGTQTWFAENLKYIPENTTSECYQDNQENCFIYGRWYRNDEAQTACPNGWHLPTSEEFQTLIDYLGGNDVASLLLIPDGSIQGELVNFNLLSGGYNLGVNWLYITERSYLWASDESIDNPGWFNSLKLISGEEISINDIPFHLRLNCRCIKD